MTKKLRGTKNPITLRHLLPIAVAILLVASMMLVGAASAADDGGDTYVAQIGETKYETLQAAVAAANAGETVTLLDNVVVSETITIDEAITLDLGGKTISVPEGTVVSPVLSVSGDATIKNGSVTGTTNSNGFPRAIDVTGNVTMDTVTVQAYRGINVGNRVVGGAPIAGTLTISNSNVIGVSYGIFVDTTGKVTINNTDITSGTLVAIQIEKGTAEFNGGTLTTVDGDASVRLASTNSQKKFIMNGGTINGWVDMWNGTFEMHGGTINAKSYTNGTPCIYGTGTFIMTNGNLNAEQGSAVIQADGTFDASMSGGTLNTTVPDDYIAEGYVLLQLSDDKYIITKPVAQVVASDGTATGYGTLQAAIKAAAAEKGDRIVMISDVAITKADAEAASAKSVDILKGESNATAPDGYEWNTDGKLVAIIPFVAEHLTADDGTIITEATADNYAQIIGGESDWNVLSDDAKAAVNAKLTAVGGTKTYPELLDAANLEKAKTDAKAAIDKAAADKKAEIDALTNLSEEKKAELKAEIDDEVDEAKTDIDSAATADAVTTAKNEGSTAIKKIADGAAEQDQAAADAAALDAAKTDAKAEINQAADDKKAEIDALTNLSSEEKAELKEKIDTEANEAKTDIENAPTSAAVTTAKDNGITVINGMTTYTITVTRSANGVATAPATAKVGETVTVIVTPETEYQFSKLNVTTENGQTIATTGKTFIMPAENVSVNAEFTKILPPPSGGGYSGGSSIWLTETPTPSETPTPTETIPTETPTVIPTEDEPKNGSYLPYIIAVLGVLAVLIIIIIVVKRRSDDEEE